MTGLQIPLLDCCKHKKQNGQTILLYFNKLQPLLTKNAICAHFCQ